MKVSGSQEMAEDSGVIYRLSMLLPRPRVFNTWKSSTAITSVANLFTEKGFIASGGEE